MYVECNVLKIVNFNLKKFLYKKLYNRFVLKNIDIYFKNRCLYTFISRVVDKKKFSFIK